MNAVIIGIQGEYAAALCDNGAIEKIPDVGYEIGQKIVMPSATAEPVSQTQNTIVSLPANRKNGTPRIVRLVGSLAATLIIIVSLGGVIAYAMPYGTVSLDSEASIEYTINCFDYVIDVSANNEEGEAVLNSMDRSLLTHQKIDNAVAAVLEQSEVVDYYDSESDVVLSVGTKGYGHSEQLAERLGGVAGHTQVFPVTITDVETAHKNGLTAGQSWLQNQPSPASGTDVTGNTEATTNEPPDAEGNSNGTNRPDDPNDPYGNPDASDIFSAPDEQYDMNRQNIPDSAAAGNEPGKWNGAELPDDAAHGEGLENPQNSENGMNPARFQGEPNQQ